MMERLLDRHVRQLLAALATEWSPAACKHEACDLRDVAALKCLKHRAGFAVNGQDPRIVLRGVLHDQRSTHHERFLVGQGDCLASLESLPGAKEARGAHDR